MRKGRKYAVLFVCVLAAGVIFGPPLAGWAARLLYPKPYEELVQREAAEFGLEENLLYAVMKAESGFDEDAVSRAGAVGLMQLTPATFQWMAGESPPENGGADPFDPRDNLHCASALLRRLLDHYGSLDVALAAYNAGMGSVSGWLEEAAYSKDGKSLHAIPYPETAAYVKKVKRHYQVYCQLYG